LYPFFHRRPGGRDPEAPLCRPGRPGRGRGRCDGPGCGTQVGAVARRRSLPPSLRAAAGRRRPVGDAGRKRWPLRPPGAKRRSMNRFFRTTFPLLRSLDAETAHRLTILALKWGLYPRSPGRDDPRLAVDVLGLHFANPLGLAAGFDKNGEVPDAMLAMGM